MPIQNSELLVENITLESPKLRIENARGLLLEYGRFVAGQPGVASFCFGSLAREAEQLPAVYIENGGGAVLASAGERPLGFVAWRALHSAEFADAWEIKRLWVRPEARGQGLGRKLVEIIIARALSVAKSHLLLDTVPEAMPEAFRLYQDLGFAPCPPYSGSGIPGIAYLSKRLAPSSKE